MLIDDFMRVFFKYFYRNCGDTNFFSTYYYSKFYLFLNIFTI